MNTTVLRSDPERFSLSLAPGSAEASVRCAFAVPVGEWARGTWFVVGCVPSGTPLSRKSAGNDCLYFGAIAANERYTASGRVGDEGLARINAAAGGSFEVEMTDLFAEAQPAGALDMVLSFTLTLTDEPIEAHHFSIGHVWTITYPGLGQVARTQRTGVPDPRVGRIVTTTYDRFGRVGAERTNDAHRRPAT